MNRGNQEQNLIHRYYDPPGRNHKYQLEFGPIHRGTYQAPRQAPTKHSGKSISRPSHVKSCTCPSCRNFRSRPRTTESRVTYNASIRLVQACLENSGAVFVSNPSKSNVFWTSKIMRSSAFEGLKKHQRINQFPRSSEVTRKDSLSKNISLMADKHGSGAFDFLSPGFILPKERDALEQEWEKNTELPWIVKPATAACGRGVYITNDLNDFPSATALGEYVVERYVNNPLLVNGYKFDLRLYVAVLSFHPLRIYLHQDGLVRLATEKYQEVDSNNIGNRYMHLTNYSINKFNISADSNDSSDDDESEYYDEDFDDDERHEVHRSEKSSPPETKWELPYLLQHLEDQGKDTSRLMSRIEDMIIKTFISIESKVVNATERHVPYDKNCFELFGFDVLIDADLRPWLLEVNLSPSLACDAEIDLRVKSKMLSDLLNLSDIRPEAVPKAKAAAGTRRHSSNNASMAVSSAAALLGQRLNRELTTFEKRKILEHELEVERCGSFNLLFPRADSFRYNEYFEHDRPLNKLLVNAAYCRDYESDSCSSREKLQSIEMEQRRELRRLKRV